MTDDLGRIIQYVKREREHPFTLNGGSATILVEAIERVERLHYLVEDPAGDCCGECDQPFPCATRLAIDETGPS